MTSLLRIFIQVPFHYCSLYKSCLEPKLWPNRCEASIIEWQKICVPFPQISVEIVMVKDYTVTRLPRYSKCVEFSPIKDFLFPLAYWLISFISDIILPPESHSRDVLSLLLACLDLNRPSQALLVYSIKYKNPTLAVLAACFKVSAFCLALQSLW